MEWDVGDKCNNMGGGDNIEKRTTKLERTKAHSMCHVLFFKNEPNKKVAIY
jgi:hypothetical protein